MVLNHQRYTSPRSASSAPTFSTKSASTFEDDGWGEHGSLLGLIRACSEEYWQDVDRACESGNSRLAVCEMRKARGKGLTTTSSGVPVLVK